MLDRKSLLGLFQSEAGRDALTESEVLREYVTYVEGLEAQTNSYRSTPRAEWSQHLTEDFSRHGMPVVRPGRFGSGETMTVAVWQGDYREADERGILDVRATVDRLRAVTSTFHRACEEKSR